LNYPIYLRWSNEDDAWIAEVPDLPGCMADGKSEEEAVAAAREAITLWLEVAREDKREIPQPSNEPEASGKFLVRLPRSLHRHLQLMAKKEAASLNQLVLSMLAAMTAKRAAKDPAVEEPRTRRKKSG
jgi:antitoxin HicB